MHRGTAGGWVMSAVRASLIGCPTPASVDFVIWIARPTRPFQRVKWVGRPDERHGRKATQLMISAACSQPSLNARNARRTN